MGFNIAGLVINQNYEKDINKLSQDLKWDIEILEEIDFETASSNWTPDDEFRLHFTDKATMIFFPHDWVADQFKSDTADTLNYAYSATSMAFQVDLFRSGELVRSITEFDDEKKYEEGQPLALEQKHSSADALTFALIDEMLDDDFGSIDLSSQSYRCKKILRKQQIVQQVDTHREVKKKTSENVKIKFVQKKWWQFWK